MGKLKKVDKIQIFFISKDWNFGLYGHPWKKELIVVGEDLIFAIEKNCAELGLKRKSLCRKQITMPNHTKRAMTLL